MLRVYLVQMAKVLPVEAAVMVYVSQVLTPVQNLLAMEALERRNLDRAAVSVEVLPLREHTHQLRITLQNLETVQIRLALVVK